MIEANFKKVNTTNYTKALAVSGLISLMTLSSGCAWKPDLTVSELQSWQLPNSEFVQVADLNMHVVQSPLCQTDPINHVTNVNTAQDQTAETAIETIVLIHGTSASLHTWNGWSDRLDDNYCVVRMDLPGFGLTGPYETQGKTYNMDNYVDAIIGLMDELNVKQATIAGNSLGGGIAWLTTLQHPERVSRLILVDSMGYEFTPEHFPIGFRLAQYPLLAPLTENVLPRSMVRSSIESVYADDSKVTEDLVDRYFDLTRREGNRQALTQRLRELHTMSQIDKISHITQPTLILWGAQDHLIPAESAYKFHQDIPNSQLVVLENLGHVPHEEDAETTVAIVEAFLERTSTDTAESN